jgi:hypothetical protein
MDFILICSPGNYRQIKGPNKEAELREENLLITICTNMMKWQGKNQSHG